MAALFGGWSNTDLSKFDDDKNFAFLNVGSVDSFVGTWSKTIPSFGGVKWTKRWILQELALGGAYPRIIGSPQAVGDFLQEWVQVAGVDGFNSSQIISPGTFEDLIKYFWPELKKRKLIRE